MFFNRPGGNIAFDTLTDLGFFWLGAFFCARLFSHDSLHSIILIVLGIAILFPIAFWYGTKIYLQNARCPFQFRLSQWNLQIDAEDIAAVNKFLQSAGNERSHLLVFGTDGSGKTSLAVGIANELSIKHQTCAYTTATKLYSLFAQNSTAPPSAGNLWNWRTASTLVIDDVNPGDPVKEELISAAEFQHYILGPYAGVDNTKAIVEKNLVWVLGTVGEREIFVEQWKKMLAGLGVLESDILVINLP
jgi:hypothetical protein